MSRADQRARYRTVHGYLLWAGAALALYILLATCARAPPEPVTAPRAPVTAPRLPAQDLPGVTVTGERKPVQWAPIKLKARRVRALAEL